MDELTHAEIGENSDNPLELIFNPQNKKDHDLLIKEAKQEYEANFNVMDMDKSYDALFEILCLSEKLVASWERRERELQGRERISHEIKSL